MSRLANSIRSLRRPRRRRRTRNVLYSMIQSPRYVLPFGQSTAWRRAAGIFRSTVTLPFQRSIACTYNRPPSHLISAPRHRTSRLPPHCQPSARLVCRHPTFDVHRPHSTIHRKAATGSGQYLTATPSAPPAVTAVTATPPHHPNRPPYSKFAKPPDPTFYFSARLRLPSCCT